MSEYTFYLISALVLITVLIFDIYVVVTLFWVIKLFTFYREATPALR